MTSFVVDNVDDLDLMTARLHDRWFDLDTLRFDPSQSLLQISFEQEHAERATTARSFLVKRTRIPITQAVLRVYFVESYFVRDEAKIGKFDFNRLIYQPAARELRVLTGIPLDFRIKVSQLKLEILDSEEVVGFRTATSLF